MIPEFYIDFDQWNAIRREAKKEAKTQYEVCGCVVADGEQRLHFHFLRNLANEPCKFEMSWHDFKMLSKNPPKGCIFIGEFHSHPIGEAVPGLREAARITRNHAMAIYDVIGNDLRLWRRKNGRYPYIYEVPIAIQRRKNHHFSINPLMQKSLFLSKELAGIVRLYEG